MSHTELNLSIWYKLVCGTAFKLVDCYHNNVLSDMDRLFLFSSPCCQIIISGANFVKVQQG